MSIASEITRINNNIASAYTAIGTAGGTVPASANSANLATAIASIPSGGVVYDENYTTVGSPTITSEYLASGFNSSNGLISTSTMLSSSFSTFEIYTKIRTGSSNSSNQIFIGDTHSSACSVALNVAYNKFYLYLSSNNSSFDIASGVEGSHSVSTNTDYYVKLVYNGTNYVMSFSTNGTTYTPTITINSSTKVGTLTPTIGGWITSSVGLPFSGSVYLKDTYVKVDGVEVWRAVTEQQGGGDVAYRYNFNIVGDLQIDNSTMVASDFSSNNYIQLQTPFNPGNNPWEVAVKFKTSSNVTNTQQIFQSCLGSGNSGRYGININIDGSNSKFNFFCSSGSSSWMFDVYGSHTVQANKDYVIKIGWTGSTYYLDYSLDGQAFVRDISRSSSTAIYSPLINTYFGIYSSSNFIDYFRGTIDLSGTYIKLNNQVWWKPEKIYDGGLPVWVDNFSKVGNPASGYLATGFTTSNYLTQQLPALGNDFDIYMKLYIGTITSVGKVIFCIGQANSDAEYQNVGLFTSNSGQNLYAKTSNTNSSNVLDNVTQTAIQLTSASVHYIKIGSKSTGTYFYHSTTGFNNMSLMNSVSTPTSVPSKMMYIGRDPHYTAKDSFGNGAVYMNEFYIESNGVEVWRGAKQQ